MAFSKAHIPAAIAALKTFRQIVSDSPTGVNNPAAKACCPALTAGLEQLAAALHPSNPTEHIDLSEGLPGRPPHCPPFRLSNLNADLERRAPDLPVDAAIVLREVWEKLCSCCQHELPLEPRDRDDWLALLTKAACVLTPGTDIYAATARSEPKYGEWAFGCEHDDCWHVFKRQGGRWYRQRRLERLPKGLEAQLLKEFAQGRGVFPDDAIPKVCRQVHPGRSERDRLMKIVKPALTRLRKILLAAMGASPLEKLKASSDPLRRDRRNKSWQAQVQIGFAIKKDPEYVGESRYHFKTREQLTTDEQLDRPTTNL